MKNSPPPPPVVQDDELDRTLDVLENLASDRGLLASLSPEQRGRLLRAAGRLSFPGREDRRRLTQSFRDRDRARLEAEKKRDRSALNQVGIRKGPSSRRLQESCPPHPPELVEGPAPTPTSQLGSSRNCYICKKEYRDLHFFYDSLCEECAAFNWAKREEKVDLRGRIALVTGGRIKIGYQAALRLLRNGASVVVTTRFPRDATTRFLAETDHGEWISRLQIHGLDLRNIAKVESLAESLNASLPRLDFILNNACQTVRRPPGFYRHMLESERAASGALPLEAHRLLSAHLEHMGREQGRHRPAPVDAIPESPTPAELSQIPLVDGDHLDTADLFPRGVLDVDLQQVDRRKMNSWRLRLAEVSTVELLEVHLINAIAPYVLNGRLKPLMTRVETADKHIVNVSAMEGVFYRAYKTDKHPHTNMAKAALNMMTRTSAKDYVRDGIHMNSVDTGWITDEDPVDIAERKKEELDFHPPLDALDAAARICDPIFSGFKTGEHAWGKFFKDYRVSPW